MHVVQLNTRLLPSAGAALPAVAQPIVLTENDLCDRLAEAEIGDVITYHVGMLARDRAPQTQALSQQRCQDLGAVADRVLRLAEAGWVHLVQRRLGEGRFAYLLIVRPRSRSAGSAAIPALVAAQLSEVA